MSDYKDYALVVQSNKFVRESYNSLNANCIKAFDLAVSCIDTRKPKKEIQITKTEFLKALNIGDENYSYAYKVLKKLRNSSWTYTDPELVGERGFIEKFDWIKENDLITIYFTNDVYPMLVELKKNFLQFSFQDLNCMKSKYSMLLYKYVLSYVRQFKTNDFVIPIEEIRASLNLKNKYNRWAELDRNVFKVFESEINNSQALPYLVRYEKQIKNKSVVAIRFIVRPRTSNKETNFLDVDNPIMYEELNNELIKGDTPIEEIRNRQADEILKNK